MKTLCRIIILGIFFLTSCAPTAQLPTIKSEEVRAEEDRQRRIAFSNFTKSFQRVHSVAYKVNKSNSGICRKTSFSLGFDFSNEDQVNKINAKYYPKDLNIGPMISIVAIAEGSPAAKSNLKIGDQIYSLNGVQTIQGKKAVKQFSNMISNSLGSGPTKIMIIRNEKIMDFDLYPEEICDYSLIFTADQVINAFADGKNIYITWGIASYTKNDNELALVIGHELAHNDRGHIRAKKTNALLAGLLGLALDMATSAGGGYSGGTYTEYFMRLGAQVFSVGFEQEADYAGLYYSARAGFAIDNANEFWTRMGAQNPSAIAHNTTHPATAARFVALRETVKEIKNKVENGLPLVPNEKKNTVQKKKIFKIMLNYFSI